MGAPPPPCGRRRRAPAGRAAAPLGLCETGPAARPLVALARAKRSTELYWAAAGEGLELRWGLARAERAAPLTPADGAALIDEAGLHVLAPQFVAAARMPAWLGPADVAAGGGARQTFRIGAGQLFRMSQAREPAA